MATDKLQAERDHAALIDLLHHLGTHRSGRAKGSTARKSTAAEVPQKGGQIKVEGPPTKAAEPLIQRVDQHEDQTTGVEDETHGKAARDPLDPVGEPQAFGPPFPGVRFAPPSSCQAMPQPPPGTAHRPKRPPAAPARPVFGHYLDWDEVQRRISSVLLSGPKTKAAQRWWTMATCR